MFGLNSSRIRWGPFLRKGGLIDRQTNRWTMKWSCSSRFFLSYGTLKIKLELFTNKNIVIFYSYLRFGYVLQYVLEFSIKRKYTVKLPIVDLNFTWINQIQNWKFKYLCAPKSSWLTLSKNTIEHVFNVNKTKISLFHIIMNVIGKKTTRRFLQNKKQQQLICHFSQDQTKTSILTSVAAGE